MNHQIQYLSATLEIRAMEAALPAFVLSYCRQYCRELNSTTAGEKSRSIIKELTGVCTEPYSSMSSTIRCCVELNIDLAGEYSGSSI